MKTISPEEFRTRRSKLGMSQAELSAALGVTKSSLRKWEHGPEPARPNTPARPNRVPEVVLRLLAIIEAYRAQQDRAREAAQGAS